MEVCNMLDDKFIEELKAALKHADLSVESGRFRIKSYKDENQRQAQLWVEASYESLIEVISDLISEEIFEYVAFDTGQYGQSLSGGVALQFIPYPASDEDVYCIFNAHTLYSKGNKAGKPLPKRRFVPPKNGKFMKFWRSIGLRSPRRASEQNEIMHLLSGRIFGAERSCRDKNRLNKDTVRAVNIASEDLKRWFYARHSSSAQDRHDIGMGSAESRHDTSALICSESSNYKCSEQYRSRINHYGKTAIREKETRVSVDTELWLDEYSSESIKSNKIMF
jgi:hypothetical protein